MNNIQGFQKLHETQHSFIKILKNGETIDKSYYIGFKYTDLSNSFFVINCNLLMTNLKPYNFLESSLCSYLKNKE